MSPTLADVYMITGLDVSGSVLVSWWFPYICDCESYFPWTYSGTCSSRTRENRCPLAQKILDSVIRKHCSMKTLRIREGNPAAWYSNNVRQPVITPDALSQSIK
jgi:hypothetical protein